MKRLVLILPFLLPLAACDQLGLDTPAKIAANKEAEGKAIGSACRNAMRAIEDCYTLNPKAQKAAVFAGWMEMDQYMRDNKLTGTTPVLPRPGSTTVAPNSESADDDSSAKSDPMVDSKAASKTDMKADTKADAKADAKPDMKSDSKADKADKPGKAKSR
ncbi:MAG TPA: hypothetical protein VGM81_07275 [Burkholderiaceae bacterium]|jgi:hypothetical protein